MIGLPSFLPPFFPPRFLLSFFFPDIINLQLSRHFSPSYCLGLMWAALSKSTTSFGIICMNSLWLPFCFYFHLSSSKFQFEGMGILLHLLCYSLRLFIRMEEVNLVGALSNFCLRNWYLLFLHFINALQQNFGGCFPFLYGSFEAHDSIRKNQLQFFTFLVLFFSF